MAFGGRVLLRREPGCHGQVRRDCDETLGHTCMQFFGVHAAECMRRSCQSCKPEPNPRTCSPPLFRAKLFKGINAQPTLFEIVTNRVRGGNKKPKVGLTLLLRPIHHLRKQSNAIC
eukprot:352865-Chlamydomonas_euryale.AAC.8